jgi:dCMP deaminase
MLIIGITGTTGAGKGTTAEYLVKNKNFKHYSVLGFLEKELSKRKLKLDRDNLRKVANELREKYGPDYITQKLFEAAQIEKSDVVIESIRNPKEAKFIKSHGGYLIAITAQQKLRYERIKLRGSEKDKVSFKEFRSQEKSEFQSKNANAQNLPRCIKMADYKIANNSTIDNLNKKIEEVINRMKKYKRPSWDDYFMEVTNAIGRRGTCDRGRSGCIIAKDKQILATGYVGSPAGFPHCDEAGHDLRKTLEENGSISLHCVRTVHAEQNAICQAAKRGTPIDGATVYCKMTPCRTCAMLLINCGIKRVYAEKKYYTGSESEKMLKKAGVKIGYKFNEVEKYANQKV